MAEYSGGKLASRQECVGEQAQKGRAQASFESVVGHRNMALIPRLETVRAVRVAVAFEAGMPGKGIERAGHRHSSVFLF